MDLGRARHPWEHVDEVVAVLKTAFPLLPLSLETVVDQLSSKFKPPTEEELFRFIGALLQEGIQVCIYHTAVHRVLSSDVMSSAIFGSCFHA